LNIPGVAGNNMTISRHPVGSGGWLLTELRGAKLFDKCVLYCIKGAYLAIRAILRLFLGREKRDKFCLKYNFNFEDFLYGAIEFLRLDKSFLVVFSSPKHDYRFYSRITRKVNNFLIHDVYTSMVDHEEDIVQQFSPKKGDIVIDVGAAFGFYSIVASKMVGQQGKVVAIEPQPDSFEMLNKNIKLNSLTNISTLNYAVSSKKTTLKLYSSYSILQERAGQNPQQHIEVSADTLDNLLGQLDLDKANWIKVDVEGAELEVLKGAEGILSKSSDLALFLEVHSASLLSPIQEICRSYGLTLQFKKVYDNGSSHLLLKKRLNSE
jgi:FkbM family methyltransferase